jgi:excisionase family DNA binding protein
VCQNHQSDPVTRTISSSHKAATDTSLQRVCCSIPEAARLLGIGRTSLYALIRDGHLEARKIGRRTVVLMTSIDRLVASLPAAWSMSCDPSAKELAR